MGEDRRNTFEHPLVTRYGSVEMSALWSPDAKFGTWRQLWLALAESERELGLEQITESALKQMRDNLANINYKEAEEFEKKMRHDVMSHIHAFGLQCPEAKKIIHLGATSCFVTDNADLINLQSALRLTLSKTLFLMKSLSEQSLKYKGLPTLGFTHYQPAQLTTVGKRISLWLQDFVFDFADLERLIERLPFRGVKGTTGSQASFLELFGGDHQKVVKLDERVAERMGFKNRISVCGQTYTRKLDFQILTVLSGIAQSAHKMCTDIRLLSNLQEIEEPFAKNQIGSSAMPWKSNPMRSERVCSLARYVMSLTSNAANTHATQWFERTLDDSANRRMCLPEAFLAVDSILDVTRNIVSGMQVWPHVIGKHLKEHLPFMASENILMACVQAGGDRQELHEAIRQHSLAAGKRIKENGAENDLLSRIASDSRFSAVAGRLDNLLDPVKYIGRCPEQVDEFVGGEVASILSQSRYQELFRDCEEVKLRV